MPGMQNRVDVGGVLSRVFSIYQSQAAVLLPLAFGLFLLVAVVTGLLPGVLAVIGALVGIVAQLVFQGTVVKLVEDVQDGRRDHSAGDLIESVRPVLWPLFLVGLLVGLIAAVPILITIGIAVIAGALAIPFGLAAFVAILYILVIFSVAGPVVVVERPGVVASLHRSRELVRGHGWTVLGIFVVLFLIVFILSIIFGAIGAALGDSAVVRIIVNVISSTITAPLTALAAAVLYFTLRGSTAAPAGDVAVTPDTSATPPPPPPPPPTQ